MFVRCVAVRLVRVVTGVHRCLPACLQGEVIKDFTCETCAKKTDCNKRVCLDTMSNTLILHLKVRRSV